MTASATKSRGVALVLSALVLPGLGQVYLGRRVLGVVLILAATTSVVAFVGATAVAASHLNLAAVTDPDQVRQLLPDLYRHAAWGYRLAVGLLAASWVAGIADALRPAETAH
ncbi:MAG TPA: hypothetical protein VGB12_03245 [bacterium]